MIQTTFFKVTLTQESGRADFAAYFLEKPTISQINAAIEEARQIANEPVPGEDEDDSEFRYSIAEKLDLVAQLANVLRAEGIDEAIKKGPVAGHNIMVAGVHIGTLDIETHEINIRDGYVAHRPAPPPQPAPVVPVPTVGVHPACKTVSGCMHGGNGLSDGPD